MLSQIRPAVTLFILLTVLTGVLYPAAVTIIAQVIFPNQANGSLITRDNKKIGSELIGQSFTSPKYFWGRISATSPMPYNAGASSGSNLGPTNPALITAIQGRIDALKATSSSESSIPVDLVTASASGLDPHISIAAAEYQVSRIAKARDLKDEEVRAIVREATEGRQFGVLGEPRINVLHLNLALDKVLPSQ